MRKVLRHLDLALMSSEADAQRIVNLGCEPQRVFVTGNIKFDLNIEQRESELTNYFRERFGSEKPIIIAASTHEPEEKWILAAFAKVRTVSGFSNCRLIIVPRHSERFERVASLIKESGFRLSRRSSELAESDKRAEVILLDSVGELRSVYPLATLVFVGGSLIPHGGQNILEPAAAQKPIVTGFYTLNFAAIVRTFLEQTAVIQLPKLAENKIPEALSQVFLDLLNDSVEREKLANNAFAVLQTNAGATDQMLLFLKKVT